MTKEDAKSKRLKVHTEIAMVHGSAPSIYLAWENIASDPNLTCEVLYRTLIKAFAERPVRPPRMYLQLDNCIRENKNTVFISYLCWLVERNVFKEIYLSFLPVGHTHFDCDQCASCIGTAVRYTDITNTDQLLKVLGQCYSPRPDVSFILEVADVAALLNPSGTPDFPVASSIVRRIRGVATKEVTPGREMYMDPTSPLHWLIRKDTRGKVFLQTKATCDDKQWSEQFYPWTPSAPRPDNRDFAENTSGLLPGDLKCKPPRPLAELRERELTKSIEQVRFRILDPDDMALTEQLVQQLKSTAVRRVPAHGWAFPNEGELVEAGGDKEQGVIAIRPVARVYATLTLQNLARENRKRRGRAENELVIGKMVAIETHYTEETPEADKHDFWTAKITKLDIEDQAIQIRWWHTGTKKNLKENTQAQYRPWSSRKQAEWIPVTRILAQFELTNNARIKASVRKRIANAIILNKADRDGESSDEGEGDANGEGDDSDESDYASLAKRRRR